MGKVIHYSKTLADLFFDEPDLMCYWCEACQRVHVFSKAIHVWNNDADCPTVTPSLKHTTADETGEKICHTQITNGRIRYYDDCTHQLKNTEMELVNVEDKIKCTQWHGNPY